MCLFPRENITAKSVINQRALGRKQFGLEMSRVRCRVAGAGAGHVGTQGRDPNIGS